MFPFPNYVDIDYGEKIDLTEIFSQIVKHYENPYVHLEGKLISSYKLNISAKVLRSVIYGVPFAFYPDYTLKSLEIEDDNLSYILSMEKEKHFLRFYVGSLDEEVIKKVRDDRFDHMRYIDHECNLSGYFIVEQYRWKLIDRILGHHINS